MAKIKIIGRKEPIEIENNRAKQIKILRFGDVNGNGKADPKDDIDLGDEWAGKIGQIDWIELDRYVPPPKTRPVQLPNRSVKMVPLDYKLQEGEEYI